MYLTYIHLSQGGSSCSGLNRGSTKIQSDEEKQSSQKANKPYLIGTIVLNYIFVFKLAQKSNFLQYKNGNE